MSEICQRPSGQPGLRYCPGCHRKIIGPLDVDPRELCPACGSSTGQKITQPARSIEPPAVIEARERVRSLAAYYEEAIVDNREDPDCMVGVRWGDLAVLITATKIGLQSDRDVITGTIALVRGAGGRIEIEPSVFEDVASYRVVRWTEASTGNVVYEARRHRR